MSTPVDIVERATALSTAVQALLGARFVEDLVELVRDMGIGEPVKVGLQALVRAMELIEKWIGKLEQVVLLPRLLQELAPAFEGLEALAGTGGDELRDLGLDTLAPVADAARGVLGLLDRVRRGALEVLGGLMPEALEAALARLRLSLGEIAATLRALQARLDGNRA